MIIHLCLTFVLRYTLQSAKIGLASNSQMGTQTKKEGVRILAVRKKPGISFPLEFQSPLINNLAKPKLL
ncbi:hypothetical protein N7507_006923 [Penicillium longicatenatum]|nr:hypothetical protein N7507_006923 [Penicillium longicatenatum]